MAVPRPINVAGGGGTGGVAVGASMAPMMSGFSSAPASQPPTVAPPQLADLAVQVVEP